MDGRFDPFSDFWNPGVTLSHEYIETYQLKSDLRPFLRKYGISYLLVGKDIPLYRVIEQSRYFARVYDDAKDAVFRFDDDAVESSGAVP